MPNNLFWGLNAKLQAGGSLPTKNFDTHFKALVISQVEYNHLCMNW